MSLESPFFEKEKQGAESEKNSEKETAFEIKKEINGYNISIEINKGQEPIKGKIDFTKKDIILQVTPEGIKEGVKFATEKLAAFNNKWENWLQKKKAKTANETIKNYAKQEEREETKVIKEFLEEIESEKK